MEYFTKVVTLYFDTLSYFYQDLLEFIFIPPGMELYTDRWISMPGHGAPPPAFFITG